MTENDSTEPRTKGYGSRTITEYFDDLAENVFVTIKNPALLPAHALAPKRDISQIRDRDAVREASNEWLASFVVDWRVYDVTDESDDPQLLGDPSASTLAKLPAAVSRWIIQKINEVSDPR